MFLVKYILVSVIIFLISFFGLIYNKKSILIILISIELILLSVNILFIVISFLGSKNNPPEIITNIGMHHVTIEKNY